MESIETLNKRLEDFYGKHETGIPNWRLGYSTQTELQVGKFNEYSEGGIYLRTVEGIREVPKYGWIKPPKWILEHLDPVSGTDGDLSLTTKLSYEPRWVFGAKGDPNGKAIDPDWEMIEAIIQTVLYGKPQEVVGETLEDKDKRINNLIEELFGDSSEVTDALHYKEGIVVPNSYDRGE